MTVINRDQALEEIASIVSTALENAGVDAILTGGGAVSIYSDNQYESYDLDFISTHSVEEVTIALLPLGFSREPGHRHFTHPDTEYYVEFPAGPLAFGEMIVSPEETDTLKTPFGILRVITPTQAIMDRIAAFV